VTFNQPGTYSFACTPHPSMIGQVIVTGPALASAPVAVVDSPAARSSGNPTAATPADHDAIWEMFRAVIEPGLKSLGWGDIVLLNADGERITH
jgi:hypothetical protein